MRYLKLLNVLIVLILISSCNQYKPPQVELCGVTGDGDAACNDQRLPDNQQNYFRPLNTGDLCTNPNDYEKMRTYCIDLRERLINCERGN